MGIGAGIFLLALGAILAFAVDFRVSGIEIQTIGVILMVAGAIGILLDLLFFAPRRRRVSSTQVTTGPAGTERTVRDEDVI